MKRTASIAVIGAGFSGSLLAVHLLERCGPGIRIHLIERNQHFGRGLAYSTGNSSHLLNMRAGNMSAFNDRPGDFVSWLRTLSADFCPTLRPSVEASSFVSRRLFGAYVQHLLGQHIWDKQLGGSLNLIADAAVDLECDQDGVAITLDVGKRIPADLAVLAVGNFPPAEPLVNHSEFYTSPYYRADPWTADALADLDREAPVLLIGTGLTMVDMVMSLLDQKHTGPIHALSRRGLTPHVHGPSMPVEPFALDDLPGKLSDMPRMIRRTVDAAQADGRNWRSVMDGLRPMTQELWQRLSIADQKRFLRHLRPWWDVHRHRIATQVEQRLRTTLDTGQLSLHAGKLLDFSAGENEVLVTYRPRHEDGAKQLSVARVINCSGPGCDYGRIHGPLIRSLLRSGTIQPDPLRLGLNVTATGNLVAADGMMSNRLYAIGPLARGVFWEITAVPDIRRQAETLAAHLAERIWGRDPTSLRIGSQPAVQGATSGPEPSAQLSAARALSTRMSHGRVRLPNEVPPGSLILS